MKCQRTPSCIAADTDQQCPASSLFKRSVTGRCPGRRTAVLNLFAEIDQDDTNWFITLKDVGPDVSVRSVREGEREISSDLAEREVTRGWLKASHRAIDPKRSKPWRPWHPLTRAAQKKVKPGEITEYAVELMATANFVSQRASDLP